MKPVSYWIDTAPRFQGEAGGIQGRTDVAVIGGGFTGLSAALALAKMGTSVTLLEAERIGNGGSGRNGGMCSNGLAIDFVAAAQRFGHAKAVSFYRAYDTAVDNVEAIIREEGIDCDFKRTGKIKLAAKPNHFEKLVRTHDALVREADRDVILMSRSQLSSEIGSDHFFGGLVQTKSAGMHMGKFVAGLASSARRHGARIYENAAVTKLRRISGHRHEIATTRGTLEASQVLLATGALTIRPQYYRRRIVPVGSFIIVTEPLSKTLVDSLMPTRRNASDSMNLVHYFRITPDSRLLFGGRARFALSDPKSDAKSGRILQAAMVSIFPQLRDTRIDYCWGGLVDLTADRLPRAGEHEGLYYSMGYSGHGTQMATYMGIVMANLMSGRPAINVWGDLDWPAIPGHFGRPWFLPLVGAYYRLQDVLH